MVTSTGGRPTKPRARGMMSSSTSVLKKTTPSKATSSPNRPIMSSGLKTPTSISKGTSPGNVVKINAENANQLCSF